MYRALICIVLAVFATDHAAGETATPATPSAPARSPAELPQLLKRFKEETVFYLQLDIAQEIVRAGSDDALKALEAWLDHEDRHIRGNAAYVFAARGKARGFDVIYGILSDRSDRPLGQGIPFVVDNPASDRGWLAEQIRTDRYYAVHLLGELRDPRVLDVLLPLMDDSEVSYKVAWALGEIRDARAIPVLIEALKNPDALVRSIAIQSLVQLHAREARPYIEALISDTTVPNAGERVSVGDRARTALEAL